jgi:hypothetical protein
MDDKEWQAAFNSALTTEHFVLQTAATATVSDAAARASLYMFSLSSSLVAMGFTSGSLEVFLPFAATVLPALFLLGIFTVVRLVDTGIENQPYHQPQPWTGHALPTFRHPHKRKVADNRSFAAFLDRAAHPGRFRQPPQQFIHG